MAAGGDDAMAADKGPRGDAAMAAGGGGALHRVMEDTRVVPFGALGPVRAFSFEAAIAAGRAWGLADHVQGALCMFLRAGDQVLDLGAHVGLTALVAARCVGPTGRVLAVEASPDTAHVLVHNAGAARAAFGANIVVVPGVAVWSHSGGVVQIPRHVPGRCTVDRALALDRKRAEGSVHHVPTLTVDDIVQRAHLESLRLLKIDVEGCELEALHGATRTLAKHAPLLLLEIGTSTLPYAFLPDPQWHERFRRVQDFLRSFGYVGPFLLPNPYNCTDFFAWHPRNGPVPAELLHGTDAAGAFLAEGTAQTAAVLGAAAQPAAQLFGYSIHTRDAVAAFVQRMRDRAGGDAVAKSSTAADS